MIVVVFLAITLTGVKVFKADELTKQPAKPSYPVSNPASLQVVVNKQHPLNPKTYTPAKLVIPNVPLRSNITATEEQLSGAAAPALVSMVNAAKQHGVLLNLQSGYRSYTFQSNLYSQYVKQQGQSLTDTASARPGYSEHQTGLAVDLGGASEPSCNVRQCFADTTEYRWLAKNTYRYGFIERYPKNRQAVTGYEYEPWHYRYIGTGLAQEMHSKNIVTLEEYFNL